MSLPVAFADGKTYFRTAVGFLHNFSWIYREPNTSCLKSLDSMPCAFKNYFLGLSNEQLNKFPFVRELLDECNEEVLRFRQQVANLTPSPSTLSSYAPKVETTNFNICRKISQKKVHEIEQLSANIHGHCPDTQFIIDLGSGLGYLSEALLKLNNKYLILGLEADEKRVHSARQRSKEFLTQERYKSISYQQLFIKADADSCGRIDHFASELAQSNGLHTATALHTTIIGLHACADLSVSAMLLFLAMPQARCLHIMPCCYHKLALRQALADDSSARSPFINFPLSIALREAMSANSGDACFNRPFMRLACQQSNSRWRCNALAHAIHGNQMFLRALAGDLCDVDEVIKVKRHDKSQVNFQSASNDRTTFEHIKQKYELHNRKTGHPQEWQAIHETRFCNIIERYTDGQGSTLAEALCCLQASIQQLCENLVLYDRLCYLKEVAEAQQLQLEVRFEKLFNEKVSPRCHVLIAEKL